MTAILIGQGSCATICDTDGHELDINADGSITAVISGGITFPAEVEVSNDSGSPIPVSDGGGSLTVDGPLTDVQMRASAVPVSGPLTDTQLRATPVPVDLSDTTLGADLRVAGAAVSGGNPVPVTGTVTATLGEIEVKNDTGNPVPVSDAGGSLTVDGSVAVSNFPATQPISGTVTANLGTIDGVATQTTLADILTELGTKLDVGGEVALDAATLAALEAITATVSGTVAVSNFPASVEVSNDSGNALSVSGTVTANLGTIDGVATETTLGSVLTELGQKLEAGQEVALDAVTLAALETISVANFPATQPVSGPLTDTQLRATPVGVSLPALPNVVFAQVAVTVGQVAVPTTALTGRKTISIKALAANGATVYVGETGVDTTTGWEMSAGDSIDIDVDDTVALFAVSASGTQRISVIEVA